nr:protein phosphatase inhibitor 2 [Hymenolepis microstoma]
MSEEEDHPKGILKHSDVEEKKDKKFQWDEMNILATYHPADKTYGHMKVDEAPTPYNHEYNRSRGGSSFAEGVNPDDLACKLAAASEAPPKMLDDDKKHDADAILTPEEAEHRRKFEERRKKHYNEYQAVLALRRHHGSEDDDDADEDFVDPIAARNARLNAQIHSTPDLEKKN